MIPTMSDLGLTSSGNSKRNEDEQRRLKMRRVLTSIGAPKGRVSEEGIARISRRVGFANDIDAEKLTPEEKERKVGNRSIAAAGNAVVVEIELKSHIPRNVQISYSVTGKALEEQAVKANKILLDDLKTKDGVGLQTDLGRFERNLERLAKLDRLSSGGINCFAALSGMYASLERLYKQELEAAKAEVTAPAGDAEVRAAEEVMSRKSGRPVIHENGRLGLALDYWPADRHSTSSSVLSLDMEVESAPAGLFPSLRVSDTWLPDPLELSKDETIGTTIPWQEPPPTLLQASTGDDNIVSDGQPKLPDLRFVAKLDPPFVVPYAVAMNILGSLGLSQPPMISMPPSQYASILLDSPATNAAQQGTPFSTTGQREVLSRHDGQEKTVLQEYTLETAKAEYGIRLENLPFSHPRNIVELLPTLRQWAFLSQLLKGTFRTAQAKDVIAGVNKRAINGQTTLDNILAPDDHDLSALTRNPVTIALITSPTPTLNLTFPTAADNELVSVNVQILPNAVVVITSHDGLLPANGDNASETLRKLAKALQICGDLGLWVEWVRTSKLT